MGRDPNCAYRANRALLGVLGFVAGLAAVPLTAGAMPVDSVRCGSGVDSLDSLNEAIAAFNDPDNTCTEIHLESDVEVDAVASTVIPGPASGPIAVIGSGEIDALEPISKPLLIDGHGHVLTGKESPSGFIVKLGGDDGPYTLTIRHLGLRQFGGSGALSVASGNVDIERSRFSDNSYDGASLVGELLYTTGGAINALGEIRIVESEFIGNAGSFGGALHSGSSNLVEITATTFAGNIASTIGGALHAEGPVTIRNSTISGNSAATSGGINAAGSVTIDFCTIVDNVSELSGAAVSAAGDVVVTASILYQNPYLPGSNPPAFSDVTSEGSLVIETSLLTSEISVTQLLSSFVLDDSNIIGQDPDLRSLGDHGGFDLPGGGRISTRPPNRGSPVIDTVSLISVKNGSDLFDQRGSGYPRDVGGLADMGAVEYRPMPTIDYRFSATEVQSELPTTL